MELLSFELVGVQFFVSATSLDENKITERYAL